MFNLEELSSQKPRKLMKTLPDLPGQEKGTENLVSGTKFQVDRKNIFC